MLLTVYFCHKGEYNDKSEYFLHIQDEEREK